MIIILRILFLPDDGEDDDGDEEEEEEDDLGGIVIQWAEIRGVHQGWIPNSIQLGDKRFHLNQIVQLFRSILQFRSNVPNEQDSEPYEPYELYAILKTLVNGIYWNIYMLGTIVVAFENIFSGYLRAVFDQYHLLCSVH